jgi:hypothetical protein
MGNVVRAHLAVAGRDAGGFNPRKRHPLVVAALLRGVGTVATLATREQRQRELCAHGAAS